MLPQRPSGAQTGLGTAGEHLCFGGHTGPFIEFDGVKHPCQKMGVCMSRARDGRGEGRVSLPPAPLMVHPSSTPSLPAAHLQKSSSILGNKEKSELGLEPNRVSAGGKTEFRPGVSASLQIPRSCWCLAVVAEKLLESTRKKDQGLEKFRCWFPNPQILTCQGKQGVFYTGRASELSVGRRRWFLCGQGAVRVGAVLGCPGEPVGTVSLGPDSTGAWLSCADQTLSLSLSLSEPVPVGDLA